MEKESEKLIKQMEEGFQTDIPDDSKRRILENSLKVFVRKGLSGARITDIAKEAGFSQGFVYNHFKSKDDVFTEITRLAALGSGRILSEVRKFEGTPYNKMVWLAEALTEPDTLAQMHFKLALLQSVSYDTLPHEAKGIFKESAKKQIAEMSELIMEGQKMGEMPEGDPVKLALSYYAVIQGVAVMRMQSEKRLDFTGIDNLLGFLRI